MKVRTLEEIQRERGGLPHGFVLMVTGALPDDPTQARTAGSNIKEAVDAVLSELERATDGMELTGLALRVEAAEVYISEGLPNGSD